VTQINQIVKQLSSAGVLNKLGSTVDAAPSQVNQLIQLGIPTLITAMQKNASTPKGAQSLSKALTYHQDANINNLNSFLKQVDPVDGSKIVSHILGAKAPAVQQQLGLQTGLDLNQVGSLLSLLAPFLMGSLGQQKKSQNVDASGLGGLLGTLLGGSGNDLTKTVTNLLDTDHDGDIMDDVGKLLGGFLKK